MDAAEEDVFWMRRALVEARRAQALGEVPVGAVVVCAERLLGAAGNTRETVGDPTGHAEIVALRRAASRRGDWRLDDCTLYVTLEPCSMCAGALVLARVKRLVFGAIDPKAGAVGSLHNLAQDPRLNHRLEVTSGVLGEECGELLRIFFRAQRGQRGL